MDLTLSGMPDVAEWTDDAIVWLKSHGEENLEQRHSMSQQHSGKTRIVYSPNGILFPIIREIQNLIDPYYEIVVIKTPSRLGPRRTRDSRIRKAPSLWGLLFNFSLAIPWLWKQTPMNERKKGSHVASDSPSDGHQDVTRSKAASDKAS